MSENIENKNESVSQHSKCSKEKWCNTMTLVLENTLANQHKKGLSVSILTVETNEKIREFLAGIIYKKSAQDRGIYLNLCPFCGEKILWATEPEEQHKYLDL